MQNSLKILKVNSAYVKGGWEKWRKITFISCMTVFYILMYVAMLMNLFVKSEISLASITFSVMMVSMYTLMMMFIFESFIPTRIVDGTNNNTFRDPRNHFLYMPFTFSDFIFAGFISWAKWYLISNISFLIMATLTVIFKGNIILKDALGFAIITNSVIFFILGISYLLCYSKYRVVNTIARMMYNLISVAWIVGAILFLLLNYFDFNLSVLEKLCNPIAVIVSLLLIPIIYLFTKLMVINNKGRSWGND